MVPGRALHRIAKFLLPPHVCDQIVDAQLAIFSTSGRVRPTSHAC
jgi:hypothetical protein